MIVERIKPDEIEKFIELREIFIEVFKSDAPALNEQQYAQLRDNRNFVVVGATVGFELVGGLTAYLVPNYYKGGLDLFIYDIAVKTEHQRKGVGIELLKFTKNFCLEHGIKEMYVAAEDNDEQALSYYRKTDAEEIGARFFIYKFD
ncbi:GNAT family N-acetyltransferase [Paracrocinitomix mangrovi]|uniref:GNAT family N-acetyltransferase n=1 Tax=Paracrocinitomix mangrovi TaxID=2862509 RepID=UPI001C8D7E37|nr:GNAT family N-acetyltransferase [Paracrocinitomix mangrovi]UKN02955.1 GNAT family N-acetyltransferase [Paracrocinitomix mangrovi]